jgi:hypothetical protein
LENAHEIWLLTPLVSTRNAVFFMNTNYLATLGASPLFLFVFNEIPYAELSYIFEIVNHTHSVLGSITMIQVLQYNAGKSITTEAILDSTFYYFLTILDSAHDAGFRFQTVVASATGACLPISRISAADAAVHTAGCNQRCSNFICQTSWRHVRIPTKTCKYFHV